MTTVINTAFGTFTSDDPRFEGVEGRNVEYGGRGDQQSYLVGRFSQSAFPEVLGSVQLTSQPAEKIQKDVVQCLTGLGFKPAEAVPA